MTTDSPPPRTIEDVFVDLKASALDRTRFWTMYPNARRRGMGCSKACYVVFFLLEFPENQIAAAFGRSHHTVNGQVERAYADLRGLGFEMRGKGDLATFLMIEVPPEERIAPPKRRDDHPLRA